MKKIIISLLLLLLLCGCTDSDSNMPIMKIVGIYIDGDEDQINYAEKNNRLPLLAKGDKLDILIDLYGNGSDLYSFIVKSEEDKVKTLISYRIDEISEDLSKIDEGKLIYKDGISETNIEVQAEILSNEEGERFVSFFLNSKAFDSVGAHHNLILKTKLQETEN